HLCCLVFCWLYLPRCAQHLDLLTAWPHAAVLSYTLPLPLLCARLPRVPFALPLPWLCARLLHALFALPLLWPCARLLHALFALPLPWLCARLLRVLFALPLPWLCARLLLLPDVLLLRVPGALFRLWQAQYQGPPRVGDPGFDLTDQVELCPVLRVLCHP